MFPAKALDFLCGDLVKFFARRRAVSDISYIKQYKK